MRYSSVLFAALVGALSACTASDDVTLPIADAERARELRFTSTPGLIQTTREEYTRTRAARGEAMSDARVAYLRATWGRLGFFGPSFEVRKVAAGQAALVGAFYDSSAKKITVFENPSHGVLVHELVHALQDQTFDLRAYQGAATSTDEALARRAVVEGDATLAELRSRSERAGYDPITYLTFLDFAGATKESDEVFRSTTLPPFFVATPSFVYTYGASFAARRVGLLEPVLPVWKTTEINAAFREAAPRSTAELLHTILKRPGAPIAEVGLSRLPEPLAQRYELDTVDRLGAWYTYLLMRTGSLSPSLDDALAWSGDQLVLLGAAGAPPRDAGDEPRAPLGVVWTVAWTNAEIAARFRSLLSSAVGITGGGAGGHPEASISSDGELIWLERRETQVVLVRGLPVEEMSVLAASAFDERSQRLAVARRVAIEKLVGLGDEQP